MADLGVSVIIQAVDKITTPTKRITAATEKMQKTYGKASKATSMAAQAANKLSQSNETLTSKVKKATGALSSQESRLRRISKLQESISGTQSKIQANLNKRANLRGNLLDAAGLAASLALPIKAAIDFEDVMTDVTKNVANADFKTMRNAINDIAKQSPLGASGIGRLVSEAGKIGLASDKALDFARISEKMAVAFELSADEAGQYITKFKASMGLSIEQIKTLGDAINYLGDNTTSNAKNITQIVSRFGTIGLQAGLSKEQTAAFAAVLDGFAPNAETAGTAMKNLLTALSAGEGASKPAQEALESLGYSAVEVAEMMQQDAAGTIRDVFAAIGDAPEEQRLSLLKVIVGDDAIGAAGGLVTNMKAYDDAMAKVANRTKYAGSVTAEYAKKAATAKYQMGVMRSNITVMGESIGRIMLPALNKLMSTITRITGAVADFTEKFPVLSKAIIGITAVLVAGKVAAIGFGYAWTFVKGGMLSTLSAITKTRLAMTLFNKQLSAHGRLAIVSQVTGLSKAEVMNKRFTKSIVASKLSIKGLGAAMAGAPTGGIAKLVLGFKVLGASLVAAVGAITLPVAAIVAGVAAAGFAIYKYWDHVKAFLGGVVDGFKSAAAPIMDALKPFQPLFSAIGSAVGSIAGWFGKLFTPVNATTEGLSKAASAGEIFGKVLGTAFSIVTSPARALLKTIEFIVNLLTDFPSTINSAIKAISSPLESLKKVGEFIAGDWLFGGDDGTNVTASKKITQQVEQTGKIIPFPEKRQLRQGSQSDFKPLKTSGNNGTVVNSSPQYHININASGMDEQKLSRTIRNEIANREHEQKTQLRAAMYDYQENALV